MRFTYGKWLLTAATLSLLTLGCGPAGADANLAGNWKASVIMVPAELSAFVVQIEPKNGQLTAKVLNSPVESFADAKVESITADDKSVTLKIKGSDQGPDFAFRFMRGKDDKSLAGTVEFGRGPMFARLEKTDAKEIAQKDAQKELEGFADLRKAMTKSDAKEKAEAVKEFADKAGDTPLGYFARLELVSALAASGAAPEAVRAEVDKAVKVAESYDPAMKATTLEQAQANEARGLKQLVAKLKKDDKAEELKTVEPRLAKLEKEIDDAYLKTAIPFKPEPFKGRRGKSDRVVVYELFTGSECPPCVAADVAFDALTETFKPTDVVFLQYHMHIPGPDALTTKDGEERGGKLYDIPGTPSAFIDGKEAPPHGGGKAQAEGAYKSLVGVLTKALEQPAQAKLTLKATRKGDAIEVQADASEVKDPGEDVKLRLVLVEDVVRYPGGNGLRFHHHVVRGFPGGLEGVPLKEASGKQNVKVDLKELAKDLNEFLDQTAKNRPFRNEDRPMDLKNLKVVALVQNDKTKEIYQAAQVDVE